MKILIHILLLLAVPLAAQVPLECKVKSSDEFAFRINCAADFAALSSAPNTTKFSNVSCIKLVYRIQDSVLYFANSEHYRFHYDFCLKILGDSIDLDIFNQRNYRLHSKRKYVLVNLNHYKDQNRYVAELFPGEECKSEWLNSFLEVLRAKLFPGAQLSVLNNNPAYQKVALPDGVGLIESNDLYQNQSYQCLKSGIAYGYLRRITAKDIARSEIKKNDILILDNLPLHLPWVQGVITSVFQTPLSHINVLCSNRGIPNCAWKNAWDNESVSNHLNTLVKIQVRDDRVIITPATLEQARKHWNSQNSGKTIRFQLDQTITRVVSIQEVRKLSPAAVGAKAFNFSQLSQIKTSNGKTIPTPENAFAIPFHFYLQHLSKSCIPELDSVTIIPRPESQSQLKRQLKAIRKSIETTPLDPLLLKVVQDFMKKEKRFTHYRFRSSTNAEDIDGFNGAGLYESHSGSLADTSKRVEDAIRKVWASLWNYNAYMEREYFNLDHYTVAMGILAHRAFGDDKANGVAITRHLYRKGYPAYTINVQLGETSVVSPDVGVQAEQFILVFKGYENENDYSVDLLSYSSLSPGKQVLTSAQLQQLVEYLRAIKRHYYKKGETSDYYYDFALDIEFKVDKASDKIYIKQVRPYR